MKVNRKGYEKEIICPDYEMACKDDRLVSA